MKVPEELNTMQRFFYLRGLQGGKFQILATALIPDETNNGFYRRTILASGRGLEDREHETIDRQLSDYTFLEMLDRNCKKARREQRWLWVISTGIRNVEGCPDGDLIVLIRSLDYSDLTRQALAVWRKRYELWRLWHTRCKSRGECYEE